jgi:hypothetical protein
MTIPIWEVRLLVGRHCGLDLDFRLVVHRCTVREHQQRPEEGVCRIEWNLEVRADIGGKLVVGRELGREGRWPEDCKWVGSAMTSL